MTTPPLPAPARSAAPSMLAIAATLGMLWQVYVAITALRFAAPLRALLANLGVHAPVATRAFLASYQWWFIAPAICTGLLLDLVRRDSPGHVRTFLTLALCLATGLVLQAWLSEAWFRPLVAMMDAVR